MLLPACYGHVPHQLVVVSQLLLLLQHARPHVLLKVHVKLIAQQLVNIREVLPQFARPYCYCPVAERHLVVDAVHACVLR